MCFIMSLCVAFDCETKTIACKNHCLLTAYVIIIIPCSVVVELQLEAPDLIKQTAGECRMSADSNRERNESERPGVRESHLKIRNEKGALRC